MKNILILVFTIPYFLINTNSYSQEPTGAAKTYHKSLVKNLEKLKATDLVTQKSVYLNQLTQAEGAIKNIKKADPSFNITSLENEYNGYKKAYDELQGQKTFDKDIAKLKESLELMKAKQPENREGSAERNAELAAGDAEYQLKVFKKRNPEYNTSEFEKEIENFKKTFASGEGNLEKVNNDNLDLEKKVKQIYNSKSIYASIIQIEAEIQKGINEVDTYKAAIDKLIAEGASEKIAALSVGNKPVTTNNIKGGKSTEDSPAPGASWINEVKAELFSRINSIDKEITEQKKRINNARDISALQTYFRIVMEAYYWYGAKELFKNDNAFVSAHQKYQTLLTELGTVENCKQKFETNLVAFTKTVRMPAAIKKDADLEQKFKTSFAQTLSGTIKYKDETIIKVNVLDNDWTIVRHEVTGVITGRVITAAIATKKTDGRYFVYDFAHYYQDYDGSKYMNGRCDHGYEYPKEILFEHIK